MPLVPRRDVHVAWTLLIYAGLGLVVAQLLRRRRCLESMTTATAATTAGGGGGGHTRVATGAEPWGAEFSRDGRHVFVSTFAQHAANVGSLPGVHGDHPHVLQRIQQALRVFDDDRLQHASDGCAHVRLDPEHGAEVVQNDAAVREEPEVPGVQVGVHEPFLHHQHVQIHETLGERRVGGSDSRQLTRVANLHPKRKWHGSLKSTEA